MVNSGSTDVVGSAILFTRVFEWQLWLLLAAVLLLSLCFHIGVQLLLNYWSVDSFMEQCKVVEFIKHNESDFFQAPISDNRPCKCLTSRSGPLCAW